MRPRMAGETVATGSFADSMYVMDEVATFIAITKEAVDTAVGAASTAFIAVMVGLYVVEVALSCTEYRSSIAVGISSKNDPPICIGSMLLPHMGH